MSPRGKLFLWLGIGIGLLVLLVVAGIGTVLILGLNQAHYAAQRSLCGSNLRGLGSAAAVYAATWNDRLPAPGKGFGGTWLCDQSPLLRATAASMGTTLRDQCPANINQTPALMAGSPAGGFVVSGYVWTNDRSKASGAAMPAMPAVARTPPLEYHEKFVSVRKPADTELAADWVISDGPAGGKWTGTTVPTRPGVYDTSHMKGSEPAGANVAFYDMHVEWKDFNIGKATAVPQVPGGPAFWFINP